MKSVFISSVFGPASPGIIKSLAEVTRGLGGEWITSKVMRLDGQFSAMMKVSIEEESKDKLLADLKSKFTDLQFFYAEALVDKNEQTKTVNLEIDCKDRTGLTRDINNILFNLDLVVENMEFNRFHVSGLGESVFSAKLTLAVPENISAEAIAEEIETLSEDTRVNVV